MAGGEVHHEQLHEANQMHEGGGVSQHQQTPTVNGRPHDSFPHSLAPTAALPNWQSVLCPEKPSGKQEESGIVSRSQSAATNVPLQGGEILTSSQVFVYLTLSSSDLINRQSTGDTGPEKCF